MRLLALLAFPLAALAAPDEQLLGRDKGYPACLPRVDSTGCLVGFWSGMDRFGPYHRVAHGADVRPLGRAAAEPELGLDQFLARNRNTGLLILQGDTILAERYQYGRKDSDRFASASMAKTVLSMLVGIAVSERKLSIEDQAGQYVPELRSHPYGAITVRDLLTMSSGIKFDDNGGDAGDPQSDVSKLISLTVAQHGAGGVAAVAPFGARVRPAGEKFVYSSADSEVLGLVLRNAVGMPLAEYLSLKLWQPMGAEADATWLVDKGGFETGYCCINATLRDYARFGLLLANYGARDGKQIIPADWVKAATNAQAPHLRVGVATQWNGYGYQTWLIHPGEPRFAAFGARGQAIFIDAARKIVVVHTAVHDRMRDTDARREQFSLWDNVLAKLAN
jgi:CubicO group peptidase (beta-lactamase class C family)